MKGVSGVLLISGGDVTFRVYDQNDKTKFKDYDIASHDLSVTITDDDCYLYNGNYLDYSKETLGHD
jgi:hypothetical protein